ncbi:MAG: hypothetical protein DMF70_08325 [Acidobacteria bacterium]|nr:MAG: hypothetical protein DMF70_08325 [Acidobacteriota bacterium]
MISEEIQQVEKQLATYANVASKVDQLMQKAKKKNSSDMSKRSNSSVVIPTGNGLLRGIKMRLKEMLRI